jgi:CHAT domain-containing protein/tetratricopeptide (TPR) repeat protein
VTISDLGARGALPATCALLDAFDDAALLALVELDAAGAAALLDDPACETLGEGWRTASSGLRRELLERLRRERPRDEAVFHRRAFAHFRDRLARPAPPEQRAFLERALIHHLRALRELNLDYQAWGEVDELLGAAQRLDLGAPTHRDELAVYAAYNAMRMQRYDECEALLGTLLGRTDLDPDIRAAALNALGVHQMVQARYAQAIGSFEAALGTGPVSDPARHGDALINLSVVHHSLHRFSLALDLARGSLTLFQQAGNLYAEAYAVFTIGNQSLHLGRWDEAREPLERAAAIYAAAGMDARLAMVEYARGLLYQILGDAEDSEAAFQRALRIARSPEHANPITARDTLLQLGLLYQAHGRPEEAAAACLQALALAEEIRDDHWRALLLHRLGALRLEMGHDDSAYAALEAAIDLVETVRAETEGEETKIGLLGTVQQVYETMVLLCLRRGDPAAAFDFVERARARSFLDMLARRDAPLAARLAETPATLAGIQELLEPGECLLEYYTVGVLPPGDHFVKRLPPQNRLRDLLLSPPEILLFAATANGLEVHRIPFDPNQLQPLPDDPEPGRHLLTERKLRRLGALLLSPVRHLTQTARQLFLIPHGPLHYVPFAALPDEAGHELLAPGGPTLAYAPSATVLLACVARQGSGGAEALAIGYNGAGATTLLLAEHEARMVARRFGGEVSAGAEAKSGLFAGRAGLSRVHIAGHAMFRAEDPLGSYLLLGEGERVDARAMMRDVRLPIDLVTLNACTSGLSHVVPGDELLGIPRAMLIAGARTVVCALTDVDDLAAYFLMALFYQHIAEGYGPARALHAAQGALRELTRADALGLLLDEPGEIQALVGALIERYEPRPFAHSRYWAPFIVIGSP